MFHNVYHAGKTMFLAPVAVLLAVLLLPALLVSDSIPIFQSLMDFMFKE